MIYKRYNHNKRINLLKDKLACLKCNNLFSIKPKFSLLVLTMFFFALGTLPVLALISFSSFSIKDSKKSGIFFKSAGLIVIMFALFNLINSLVVIGAISPVFNF